MSLRMSESERQRFLADVHVGVLGVERADGPPLTVPVWYGYEPGGDVVMTTERTSLKGRLLAAAGRASLCAQREEFPPAYVSVEGPVTIEPADDELRRELAVRYLGDEMGRAFVSGPAGDSITLRLQPQRWWSTDYTSLRIG